MDTPAPERLRSLAKVISLSLYRQRANTVRCGPVPEPERACDGRAHVYVDLDADGCMSYGLKSVDYENAVFLLEPTLYLVGQLLKLAMQHTT